MTLIQASAAKNIVIFGASSAIAMACARRWAGEDVHFFLVGRRQDRLTQVAEDLSTLGASVHCAVCDFSNLDEHENTLDACMAALGRIDLALLAWGSLPDQEACEGDSTLAAEAFHSNGLAVVALLSSLARRMAPQASGTIAVISSVAGDRGRASNYVYGAAKAAVSTFCSGLRARLRRSGVHLLLIKPGFVATPMTQGLSLPALLVATPETVASDITRALKKSRNTLYTPWFWRVIMLVIKGIPEPVFKRLKF
ncbi:MAG: SDR family oxidoreductase [Pseudomonadota bacterium]